ncbi:hypothetical protein E5288_WYG021789 [Bos mutus]|uniref:Uncharacterized protein n=1 Tax=Bos mutus TaxID=72004 RepID=A0A6B0S902_9CETA|nr:hypothetical protein [Bos mutus]
MMMSLTTMLTSELKDPGSKSGDKGENHGIQASDGVDLKHCIGYMIFRILGSCQDTVVTMLINGDTAVVRYEFVQYELMKDVWIMSIWYVFNIAVKEGKICRWNLVGVQVPFKGRTFQWSLSGDLAGVQVSHEVSDDVHLPHITASCIHISRFMSKDYCALLHDHEKNMDFIQGLPRDQAASQSVAVDSWTQLVLRISSSGLAAPSVQSKLERVLNCNTVDFLRRLYLSVGSSLAYEVASDSEAAAVILVMSVDE